MRTPAALLVGTASVMLLAYNTRAAREDIDFRKLGAHRRLWEDLTVAIDRYLGVEMSTAASPEQRAEFEAQCEEYRGIASRSIRNQAIRPWQFWRTVPSKHFQLRGASGYVPEVTDPGRALLLGAGFRLLGGVSPFLILWIGALIAAPVLIWTTWEFFEAGLPVAGAVFTIAIASSPFVVETLSLARSAVGFHIIGLLALVPLAVHALFSPQPSTRGLLWRAFAAGLVLGISILCRSGCWSMLPAYVVSLGVAAASIPSGSPRPIGGRLLLVAGAAALLIGPYWVLRQPQHHDHWQAIWEGLGDFDRTKGHYWSDDKAREFVQRHGVADVRSDAAEVVFRRAVLTDVREDPGWLVGILAKRLFAAVTLSKLAPRGPRDGASFAESDAPNTGSIDKYYRYTPTADFVGIGRWRIELPLAVVLAPTVLAISLACLPHAGARAPRTAARLRKGLALLGLMALAALPVPVLISTGGAQDTEAFVLVHAMAFACLLQGGLDWKRERRTPESLRS